MSTTGIKPVTLTTKVIFLLAALLAVIAGIQLYILTDYTDQYFAWTIAQPLSAAFLGSGYWTGAVLLLFSLRERAWANIRIAIAAVCAFVPAMLLTTLLHLDRFHFAATGSALVAAWVWMIVYVTVPFVLLVLLIVQWRTPGGDPPRPAPLPTMIRVLLIVNALIFLALSLPMIIFPEVVFPYWPWTLTPLTSRAIGTGFLSVFCGSLQFLRGNSWRRGRVGAVSYMLIGVLQLVAILRYPSQVFWDRPGSWLYVLFMVSFIAGGLSTAFQAWKKSAEPALATN